jgi:hypothetical protein
MPINPFTIIKRRRSGDGDMATVTADGPNPSFTFDTPFVLTAIRAWATGGAGNADLTIYQKIAAERSGVFDKTINIMRNFGATHRFFHWRIQVTDEHHWVFDAGDSIVPNWTNPDPGNMTWALQVEVRYPTPAELTELAEAAQVGVAL